VLGSATSSTTAVFQSEGVFEREVVAIGDAAAGTVTWSPALSSGAGFAAGSEKLVVALGGVAAPTPLTWGVGGFVPSGAELILSSANALAEVEFRNAIDLNGGNRVVRVNTNSSTAADFATISGVISGSGALTKVGNGSLRLLGASTYSGQTRSSGPGALVVDSLGHSGVGGASSVGDASAANLLANAVILGTGAGTRGVLQYVGPGEVSDRYIRIDTTATSTTLATTILADGSGPLVLTNLRNDGAGGNKTLLLRGTNTMGNMITSQLADNSGTLAVTADTGATWILAGANTYTGLTSITGGALGAGNDQAFGSGEVRLRFGSLFAHGGDRTLGNPFHIITQNVLADSTFIGDHSIELTGNWSYLNESVGHIFINQITEPGKTVTLAGSKVFDGLTGERVIEFTGPGATVFSGNFQSITPFALGVLQSGEGSLTLSGTASKLGTLSVANGSVIAGAANVFPLPAFGGNMVWLPTADLTARIDLNGFDQSTNALVASSLGQAVLDSSGANAATLTFGGNGAGGLFAGAVMNTGLGALSLVKTGAGVQSMAQGPFLHLGATTVEQGSLLFAGNVNGTSSLSVTGTGSLLSMTGGFSGSTLVSSLTIGSGSTLSLLDGVGTPMDQLVALSLGVGAGGTATLNLNVGTGATDSITLLPGGLLSLGNSITFNLSDAGLDANSSYTLLSVPDGGLEDFGLSNFLLGAAPGGFESLTWTVLDNEVRVTTGALIEGDL